MPVSNCKPIIPYSLKFSRLKISWVIDRPRKFYPTKNSVLVVYVCMHITGLALDHENFIRENLFLSRIYPNHEIFNPRKCKPIIIISMLETFKGAHCFAEVQSNVEQYYVVSISLIKVLRVLFEIPCFVTRKIPCVCDMM